jgi:hypothetical protein
MALSKKKLNWKERLNRERSLEFGTIMDYSEKKN